jgi:hypothetical protein
MITAAVLLVAQAAMVVATCRVPGDPQQRTWSLERVTPEAWRVVFSSKSLDKPRVELPLTAARPVVSASLIALSYASANGGRRVEWTIDGDRSKLDLHVNHGLEVNVERDLDHAVETMNTDGEIAVSCTNQTGKPEPVTRNLAEWQLAAGIARSVDLYQSTAGRAYAVQTIAFARDLTRDIKLIGIRGRFAWGVEATPLFAQFNPSAIYGIGFAPVVWRWNFPEQPRWSAFAELSMGGLWTSEAIPEDTSRGNFTAHWGGGVRLRRRAMQVHPGPSDAIVIAYRFQHFSNGNQLGSNPGVNSHVVLVGWSHRS